MQYGSAVVEVPKCLIFAGLAHIILLAQSSTHARPCADLFNEERATACVKRILARNVWLHRGAVPCAHSAAQQPCFGVRVRALEFQSLEEPLNLKIRGSVRTVAVELSSDLLDSRRSAIRTDAVTCTRAGPRLGFSVPSLAFQGSASAARHAAAAERSKGCGVP